MLLLLREFPPLFPRPPETVTRKGIRMGNGEEGTIGCSLVGDESSISACCWLLLRRAALGTASGKRKNGTDLPVVWLY